MKQLYCSLGKLWASLFYLSLLFLLLWCWRPAQGQDLTHTLQGRVLSAAEREPLPGASVQLRGTRQGTTTDERGSFTCTATGSRVSLSISFIGYAALDTVLALPLRQELLLLLEPDAAQLREAVVTGYQRIPRERATGSFVHVDNELLNRRVSTNLLDRLDGVASGLFFKGEALHTSSTNPLGRNLNLRIRGESTLAPTTQISRDPLIVVDHFPFEGNLDQINPNDVESITILRDAAAASIWGARAGNGVIVITTKKGSRNKPLRVELNGNLTLGAKPDLYADQNYLPAASYIEVERTLFAAGYFNADLANTTTRPPLSPVVELLAQQRAGALSEAQTEAALAELAGRDLRPDYRRYVYRRAVNQQYSVGLRGGGGAATYALSTGFDRNRTNLVGNDYQRFTLNSNATYTLAKGLELSTSLNYSTNKTTTNNYQNHYGFMPVGGKYPRLYPYARLADEAGNPLAITKDYRAAYVDQAAAQGLLDWGYRPLEETALADNATQTHSLLLRAGLRYSVRPGLSAEVLYQQEKQGIAGRDHRSQDTYYVRDLINRFTGRGPDGSLTYPVPLGGVLLQNQVDWKTDNLRAQWHLDQSFKSAHRLTALAGAEARQLRTEGYTRTSYGYSEALGVAVAPLNYAAFWPVNPAGTARIPAPAGGMSGYLNRFLSFYANAAYTYQHRYTLTLSARKDGSNIFGANTNQRFSPLWSAGGSWELSQERFYDLDWLPSLRLRASYGYSGNVYQGAVYTTGVYIPSPLTGARMIHNLTAPNPELKWEQVGTLNAGVDFAFQNQRFSGSLEWYRKRGRDLIEAQRLAPSTGFFSFTTNGAATRTQGLDLSLTGRFRAGGLGWQPTFLLSTVRDQITDYSVTPTAGSIQTNTGRPGLVGKPLYSLYSYAWAGLDPATGDPRGYLNGEVSTNYAGILTNFSPDSLVFHGSSVPTAFGALRQDFSWKGFSLSVNLVYKLGYYFRRQSVSPNYQDVLAGYTHPDYAVRWQQPGDETPVPSFVYPNNNNRSTFYRFSEELVERGDHLRVQDLRLSYELSGRALRALGVPQAQLYAYASQLGLLWKANRRGIDPDTSYINPTDHNLPRPFTLSLGFKLSL